MLLRAAIYARFSSELQRETSLDDQIAVARRYATEQGWSIVDGCLFKDSAVSGSSLDRPGIQALRAAAVAKPRRFDVLLVDDSSRVSRDLPDAVRFLQDLHFEGVRVIYISQSIDSANEQAETLVAVHGVVDSLYLREMAKKIKRGLAGQISRGFATGSITFGYRTVPMLDPSGKTENGLPVLLGKRVEIVPAEAAVIVRIFECFVSGAGATRIVDELNHSNIPGPRGARWKRGAVARILMNEKYTGRLVWGRTRFERRPGTRCKKVRAVPRDEWHIQERPELRIISTELWQRAVERWRDVRALLGPTVSAGGLMKGRNAALHSKNLFSGVMRCAVCGGSVAVVHHGSGSPRYGCTRSHRDGPTACSNRVQVRAGIADARLLAGLQIELLKPEVITYVTAAMSQALSAELERQPAERRALEEKRDATRQQIDRLLGLVESGALTGPAVAGRIAQREQELRDVEVALTATPAALADCLRIIPTWVARQLSDVSALLNEAPERCKTEFQRIGLRVSMQPIYVEQPRPFYRATLTASLPSLSGSRDLRSDRPTTDRSLVKAGAAKSWSPVRFIAADPAATARFGR
jgi:DNA invertase Pin-like site-specific DNA recombinase